MRGAATDERTFATGTPSLLRAINERTLLRFLGSQGAMSRAQAARLSGLSKPTVSLGLAALLRAGLVREVGRSTGGKGPGALLYELNPDAGSVVGIDVGRLWVRAAIADITGGIIARRDERTRARSAAALIGGIGELAHDLARQAGVRWDQVTHATMGSPGVVDPARGTVAMAPNLPGWGRRGLVEAVQRELGTGVSIENDVNLAALGEQAEGLGRGVENFVLLWIGTGVGLALVLNGRLHRGAHGFAGEIAYLPLGVTDPHDRSTRRHGPLEDAVAAAGIVRTARWLGMAGPLNPRKIFALARRGDVTAERVVELTAARLALVIATVAPLVDPELVILGGGIGRNEDLLVERIDRELRAISPFRPRLAQSALGEDAVLRGAVGAALAVAQERVFARKGSTDRRDRGSREGRPAATGRNEPSTEVAG